ncbi:MAG: hypothetical protein NVSMB55_00720 [Mycobacteriales bacterium]
MAEGTTGWRGVSYALEWLIADWMAPAPDGWEAPKSWTAVTVPDFLLAFMCALERHGEQSEAAGADGDWAVVAAALADARWDRGEPPEGVMQLRRAQELEAVRKAAPPGPEPEDDDETVAAWWQRARMLREDQPDMWGAWALWWAEDRFDRRVRHDDPESAVILLDRLLDVPDPDLCAAACCGPVRLLLEQRGHEAQKQVADHCTRYDVWRQAVWLADPANADDLHALRDWLP